MFCLNLHSVIPSLRGIAQALSEASVILSAAKDLILCSWTSLDKEY